MIGRNLIAVALVLSLCGFQVVPGEKPKPDQPQNEREAQTALPQSTNPLWRQLGQCGVDYDPRSGLYAIHVTDQVKALADTQLEANGFILPLDGGDKTKHFLLSKRTPVCMFCPPGEPNEVIEVKSKSALNWVDDMITVKGRFKLVNDGEKGVFFLLEQAEQVSRKN